MAYSINLNAFLTEGLLNQNTTSSSSKTNPIKTGFVCSKEGLSEQNKPEVSRSDLMSLKATRKPRKCSDGVQGLPVIRDNFLEPLNLEIILLQSSPNSAYFIQNKAGNNSNLLQESPILGDIFLEANILLQSSPNSPSFIQIKLKNISNEVQTSSTIRNNFLEPMKQDYLITYARPFLWANYPITML